MDVIIGGYWRRIPLIKTRARAGFWLMRRRTLTTDQQLPIDILWEDRQTLSHNHLMGQPMAASLDLLQGTLDLLVLRTLSGGPMHGYTVAREIKERSKSVFLVEEGALYPALHRLERAGFVESEWGLSENNRKAKFYQLTARGRAQLRAEL